MFHNDELLRLNDFTGGLCLCVCDKKKEIKSEQVVVSSNRGEKPIQGDRVKELLLCKHASVLRKFCMQASIFVLCVACVCMCV